MTHPDHVVPLDQREQILRVEPVYGLTAGLTQRPVQKAIAAAVERSPELPEWQDAAFHKRNKWDGWHAALARAHAPDERGRPLADASGARAPRLRRAAGEPARHRPGAPSQPHRRRPCHQGRRPAARQGAEQPALRADAEPEGRGRRDRGRHGQARAHDPPAAGRCRQRQDAGRPARHADLRRGRRAGRADGADRDPGAPAPRHHRAARRGRRRAAGAAHRPRRPEAEEGDAGAAWPTARSISSSARMRWSRRTSSSPTSRSPWSTSSIASACTSAWRCRPRAMPSTCW